MLFDILMYILVGLVIVIFCIAIFKMIYEEIKYKKLIGQDLSNMNYEELEYLSNKYERIFRSHILFKDDIFGKEAARIMKEREKYINSKENKNIIIFDPKGEPYNDFKKELRINPEQLEQLKVIVNTAVSIENTYSKFIRNVFRNLHNAKKSLFKKDMLNKNEYNFLYYVSDCLHNIPEIIEVSLQIITDKENKLDFIPTVYPLVRDEIKCLKNIIDVSNNKTRKEMKINDNKNLEYYLFELNKMAVFLDALILNIQVFIGNQE